MKLVLIAPARKEALTRSKRLLSLAPPLNLAIVAALTPPDFEVSIIDENFTSVDFSQAVDLVGITVVTPTVQRAYQIADAFRNRGVKVVLGGIHPTMLPEEAGQHADSVVLGEAEGCWQCLIDDFKADKLKNTYQNGERPSLVGLPWPRRSLFAKKGYVFSNTVSTTRGCPFACSFCAVTSFFGHTYRSRPIEDIVREICTLGNRKPIFFVDDNIVGTPGRAKQLFRALIPYRVKWFGQASLTLAKDDELLKLAAASGCVGLFIGFESVNPASLASVGKKFSPVKDYEQSVRKIHSRGIGICGSFIFGLEHDDQDVFERTVRFAQRVKLEAAQFNILVPYPGTRVYEELDRDGRIFTKDWSQYHMDRVIFEPKLMSPKTLRDGCDWAWRKFYSTTSMLRRVRIVHPNLLYLYFTVGLNWNYRRGLEGRALI